MKHSPLIFLGVLACLALSWLGMALGPELQLGNAEPQPVDLGRYPNARPGLAAQGAQIYRSLGCNYCHTQQVRQNGVEFGARLLDWGETPTNVFPVLVKLGAAKSVDEAMTLKLPLTLREGVALNEAIYATKLVGDAGAKFEITLKNLGPDITRGWGARMSVSDDYLFDYPVMLGSQRIGPDLANVGVRAPRNYVSPWNFEYKGTNVAPEAREAAFKDAFRTWHYEHLDNPQSKVKDSAMPAYTWLFEQRGNQRVPSHDAEALVEYLFSLRSDVSLIHAPAPKVAKAAPAPAPVNASPAK
jgi:cbb3-type cytochrome oxidase cytochrome c subunit